MEVLHAALGSDAAAAVDSVASDDSVWRTFNTCAVNPQVAAFVNSRSLHGRTALHIAASNGQAECVEALLRARAEIEARTDDGFSALHLACQRGHLKVVQTLHAERCDVCAQTNKQEHALHLAAAKGNSRVLAFLLEICGSDLICLRNSYGQRPVEVCRDIDTVALFSGVDGNRFGTVHSCCSGSGSEHGEGEDTYAGRTPFHKGSVVLRNSRADVVRRLLQRTGAEETCKLGADPDADAGAGYKATRKVGRKSPSMD